jgi:Zn-finger nucleic acid-binding protein
MMGSGAAYDAARRITLAVERNRDRRDLRHEKSARWYRWMQAYALLTRPEQQDVEDIQTQLRKAPLSTSTRSCLECGKPFVLVAVEGVEIDTCLDCNSFWFDAGELRVLTHWPEDVPAEAYDHAASRYRCPVCRAEMQQCRFLSPYDLMVDECPEGHGVYLEAGELDKALTLK